MRCVCGYQHILGIIRMEDEPNSPDLQKKGSLSGGRGRVSPSASHRCEPACSGNLFYPFTETPSLHPLRGFFFPSLVLREERHLSEMMLRIFHHRFLDGPQSEKPTHSFPAPSKLKTASRGHLLISCANFTGGGGSAEMEPGDGPALASHAVNGQQSAAGSCESPN